jgi:hypothetical protein
VKIRTILGCAVAALSLTVAANASATVTGESPPEGTYITYNGLDWAWAYPLPDSNGDLISPTQAADGWRLPTEAELANAPLGTQFLFAGGNVPFNGTDPVSGAYFAYTTPDYNNAQSAGACAAPYFNSNYAHCDFTDGLGQPTGPWNGMRGAYDFADQLFVRDAVGGAVPEPATWTSLIFGFGMLGAMLRRRKLATT